MSLPKRLKALQGLWIEQKGRGKTWLVEGEEAIHQIPNGKRGKKYTLTKDEDGGVSWGLSGTYILDSSFKAGDSVATWWAGSKVGFSWSRLESATGKQSDEKRIDPAD